MKIFALLALFIGECLIMATEMFSTKKISDGLVPFKTVFGYAMLVNMIACTLLILGYVYGYKAFKNIWIVTAVSIAGIVVCEPLVAWFLFKEVPTTGAGIGLVLGMVGIIITLVIK